MTKLTRGVELMKLLGALVRDWEVIHCYTKSIRGDTAILFQTGDPLPKEDGFDIVLAGRVAMLPPPTDPREKE